MSITFDDTTIKRRRVKEELEWVAEIDAADRAVTALLEAKKLTLQDSPVREQALWSRHSTRLKQIKRKLDAAVM